jgi:hypothetical protein
VEVYRPRYKGRRPIGYAFIHFAVGLPPASSIRLITWVAPVFVGVLVPKFECSCRQQYSVISMPFCLREGLT